MMNKQVIISEDKLQINLPIPLGETFYHYWTKCDDICYKLNSKQREFVKPRISCSTDSPCHTKIYGITKETLTLENLNYFVKIWGKEAFATRKEAENAVILKVKKNINVLRSYGLNINDEGEFIFDDI